MKKSKTYDRALLVLFIAAAALGLACASTPMLNVVGYETGAACSLFAALAAAVLGVIAGGDTRRTNAGPEVGSFGVVGPLYCSVLYSSAVTVALPLLIVAVNSYYVKKCNVGTDLPLVAAMVVPTVAHYAAAGLAAGRIARTGLKAAAFLFGYFILTSLHTFALFMLGAPWTLPNTTIGLFSDTGFYGFGLTLPPSFYPFRLLTLFCSLFFLGAAVLCDPAKHYPRKREDVFFGRAAISASLGLLLFCQLFVPDATGLGSGRRTLNAELSRVHGTPHTVLHYSPGTLDAAGLRKAARYAEWYVKEIRDAVPMKPSWRIHVYIYSGDEQMKRLKTAGDFYFSSPWLHEVHIQARSLDRSIFKHELTHAAMAEYGKGIFGTPYNMGLVEGIAESVEENYFRGPAFQEKFAASLKAEVLSPSNRTISNIGFGASNMWKSYSMAGGFIGFLIHKYGPEKFAEYYGNPDTKKMYGKDMKTLNAEWTDSLRKTRISKRALRLAELEFNDVINPPFYKTECPRVGVRSDVSNPYTRLQALKDAGDEKGYDKLCETLYKKSKNPEILLNRASSLMEGGKYREAAGVAAEILKMKKVPNSVRDQAFAIRMESLYRTGDAAGAARAVKERLDFGFADPEYLQRVLWIMRDGKSAAELLPEYFHPEKNLKMLVASRAGSSTAMIPALADVALSMNENDYPDKSSYLRDLERFTETFATLPAGQNKTKIKLFLKLGDAMNDAERYEDAKAAYRRNLVLSEDEKDRFTAKRRVEMTEFFVKFDMEVSREKH